MAVETVEIGREGAPQRSIPVAARALLHEAVDGRAYLSLASRVKYPVGAMLVSQTVLLIAVPAVLARSLGSRAFGQYALAVAIAGIFQLVAAFPVESGIPKFLAEARQRSPGELRAFYTAGSWCRLGAGAVALVWCLLGAGWVSRAYDAPALIGPVLVAAISLCLLTPINAFFMACIQGMEHPRRWATGNLITAALVFPAILLGARGFSRWQMSGIMWWIAAGWFASLLISGVLARQSLGFLWPTGSARAHLRQLVPFLLPMWIVPIAGFGARTVIKLLVARSWTSEALGHFEIALALLGHLAVVYQACMIVFLPEWARLYVKRSAAELLASLARARGVLLGIAVAYGAVLVFAGQWVVPVIFGQEQVGAIPAVRVIGLIMPVMIGGWVASSTNVVSNRTANVGKANVIWFSMVIPLGVVLIPFLGALGAALAWFGAYVVFCWYYVTRARPFFREVEGWLGHGASLPRSDP